MYKKLFVSLFAVALIFGFSGMASAHGNGLGIFNGLGHGYDDGPGMGPGNGNGYGHNGGNGNGCFDGVAFGSLDISAFSYGGALDYDVKRIPNGIAGGISGAGGVAGADADGFIFNGLVEGEVSTIAGGLTTTDAYRFNPDIGDMSIGVGSYSQSYAITGADAKIKVDPERRGFGMASANIFGIAGQFTLNGSALWESPIYFDSTGFTGGVAGQGSIGWFSGDAFAMSFGDRCWRDSKAGAGIGAEMEMGGYSFSESYRFVAWNGDYTTEGMGTLVGAGTYVESYEYDYDWDRGRACSYADVDGGWVAAGGAASITIQDAPGIGGAEATAVGYYVGAGSLGTNFNGSIDGYTYTSVTTHNGMNGSINSAGAGMSVSSHVTSNVPN